jgi:DTW domain-containing protein YfiP
MTTEDHVNPEAEHAPCPTCARSPRYCVCEFITQISTRLKIVILQHPQEPGVDIGTVPIVAGTFANSMVKTGLSWPNLAKAVGYETENRRWGVLYLGSVHVEQLPEVGTLFVVDKKGAPVADQKAVLADLEGVVVLDGTWSQAKTLWWRNAWLLKLKRLVLRPKRHSIYDKIRKEPRKGCLSTVETVSEVVSAIEDRSDIQPLVDKPLQELVERLSAGRPHGHRRHHGQRRYRGSRHRRGR